MTYEETLSYIYSLGRFGMKPGLERITELLDSLDNPQHSVRSVHVAGTNGKGSTSAFLSSILEHSGCRVGLFTSPHLSRFTERIRINGEEVGEGDVVRLAEAVMGKAPAETTFFEIVTAMAWLHFAEHGVDLAVMETGMGGRFDATNASRGILSLITPIGLDHCQYLGNTIGDIAVEKAGVIREGRPVVVSRQSPEALAVITSCCDAQSSPLYRLGDDFNARRHGGALAYQGLDLDLGSITPGLAGSYQLDNAATALAAAELLGGMGFAVNSASMIKGIETASWPGRMELVGKSPAILLDCAHNPSGADALAEALGDFQRDSLALVIGVMADKDAGQILAPLLPLADRVYAVSPSLERGMPSNVLATLCRSLGADCLDAGTVAEGVRLAVERGGPGDLIVVCGSIFVVGEARSIIQGSGFEPFRG